MEEIGAKKPNWILRIVIAAIAVPIVLIGLIIFSIHRTLSGMSPERWAEVEMAVKSQQIAKDSIRRSMRDPELVEFDNVSQGVTPTTVCGRVNGRNGFGGLTGFRKFVIRYDVNVTAFEGEKGFDEAWFVGCPYWSSS